MLHPVQRNMSSPTVLTIAGSDSGGGAGIQADTKTIQVHGCFATNVVTALTAQNTVGVQGIHEIPSDFVKQQASTVLIWVRFRLTKNHPPCIGQMESVLVDLPPKAVKTGMLASVNVIKSIIEQLRSTYPATESMPPIVIDPVMISTSNHTLLPSDAIGALCFGLLPLARVITPNIQETELLLRCLRAGKETEHHSDVAIGDLVKEQESGEGDRIRSVQQMIDSGKEIAQILQAKNLTVLVKGGHLPLEKTVLKPALHQLSQDSTINVVWKGDSNGADEEQEGFIEVLHAYRSQANSESPGTKEEEYVVDVMVGADRKVNLFVAPAITSASTHGTGCTLSAAIASNLALGKPSKFL
jgi:hydroxymethylpyrimidine/phosphomethylpyrimidine kinase